MEATKKKPINVVKFLVSVDLLNVKNNKQDGKSPFQADQIHLAG